MDKRRKHCSGSHRHGEKIQLKYASHGCPDTTADGIFTFAKNKGMDWDRIDTLPEIPSIALHKDGHVGYCIGNRYAVEWQGFSYGCIKPK